MGMGLKSEGQVVIILAVLCMSMVSAGARPCKTLFVSSYSLSLRDWDWEPSSSGFVTVFTEITRVNADGHAFFIEEASPSSSYEYHLSSLRDRTKDILSVVVALLFGVGCGSLTAATMYLAWSLFSKQDFCPKKMGYVNIPTADSDSDSDSAQ